MLTRTLQANNCFQWFWARMACSRERREKDAGSSGRTRTYNPSVNTWPIPISVKSLELLDLKSTLLALRVRNSNALRIVPWREGFRLVVEYCSERVSR